MKSLILMIQFFTRIPIKLDVNASDKDFSRGIIYFPFVGLIVGLFNYGIYYLVSFFDNRILGLIFWLISNILITGAIHLDGLADTCDGLFSARDKQRMLEIMKDSRVGTNGVIAIILDLILRLGILYSLSNAAKASAILLGPVVAKTLVLLLMGISKYARTEGGMGGLFYSHMSLQRLIVGITSGVLIVLFFGLWKAIAALIPSLIFILIFRKMVVDKIDGMTGDTLGAASEVSEICFMASLYLLERLVF